MISLSECHFSSLLSRRSSDFISTSASLFGLLRKFHVYVHICWVGFILSSQLKRKKKKRRRILFQHFILKLVRFYLSNDFFFSNGITSFLTGVGQQKVCWCLLEEFENPHCSSSLLKHPRETQIWNNQVNEKASYLFLPCIMLKLLSVGTFSSLFLLPLSLVSRVK